MRLIYTALYLYVRFDYEPIEIAYIFMVYYRLLAQYFVTIFLLKIDGIRKEEMLCDMYF